ncbi:Cellulase (glycosyl hydrolase family 5) [Rhizoctonia solani]|uniref:Cellulase (Glycosyl hydrolase family 5) n=1 Tax=Rhizoctonia solani TaxID=456999 RepID=A0A8H7LXD1_9AGAM|nr:Cellulase (glycosyl hydrolase family 5) [Rhizoctonia solani]
MRLHSVALGTGLLGASAVSAAKNSLPVNKVYGTNLGSWLLAEPWMFPNEWVNKMGGDSCEADCSSCAFSELYRFVKKLGQEQAEKCSMNIGPHGSPRRTRTSKNAGLNTIRIPLGYWIVESLVDRSTEYYPRGGMKYLKKGLRWLKQRGIHVMLDHHALPGVASANQMFAGTEKNYKRATIFSIEAINEPTQDATKTPGYGDYQKRFVKVVRLVEFGLGVRCPETDYTKIFTKPSYKKSFDKGLIAVAAQVEDKVLAEVLKEVNAAMKTINADLNLSVDLDVDVSLSVSVDESVPDVEKREAAEPSFLMDLALNAATLAGVSITNEASQPSLARTYAVIACQLLFNSNPADAANGPQVYDAHLYFSFGKPCDRPSRIVPNLHPGGVADPNPESYMKTICNTNRVAEATAVGNRPLVFGEWSVATNFKTEPQFYKDWLDAQRTIYAGQADGWLFWSYKLEEGNKYTPDMSWSATYNAGYFDPKDPSKLNNPDICKPWIANSTATSA